MLRPPSSAELHLADDILVPDLASWRRERFGEPGDVAFLTLAPDWVGEVLSPSTSALGRTGKLPISVREGVRHAWLVDPLVKTLEVFRLDGTSWRLAGAWAGDEVVRAEQFDAIELDPSLLWRL
jgi:Uma2 family endonuclease